MESTFPGCADAIHALNPNAVVCDTEHCSNFMDSNVFHNECNAFGRAHPNYPIATGQCIDKSTGRITDPIIDPMWGNMCPDESFVQLCYCCCSCLANGTPIAVPGGVKAIEQFNVGDDVTVGAWTASTLSWKNGSVKFSSGSDAGSPSTMMFIEYGAKKQLIASVDHLFLLAGGKLKRADRVVPHKDQLMGADGTPLDILSSLSGKWTKGLHHIATDLDFTGTLDGHLINSAGIVSGDYCLQINQHELVKMGLMDPPEVSPAHGSAPFADANPHLAVTRVGAVKSGTAHADITLPEGFTPFNPIGATVIPPGAAQFLTDAQAKDIVNNSKASFRDLHSDAGFDAANYLVTMFKGFYPDITIVIDQANPNFNTYAFERDGQKHLVVAGEIMRLNGLYADGYKFILAQGVARLLGNPPKEPDGFTCAAAADFYATSSVFRKVFYLDASDFANNALAQIQAVFGLITAANAAGDPDDPGNNPSIQCRVASMRTGIFGGDLLPCACSEPAAPKVTADGPPAGLGA